MGVQRIVHQLFVTGPLSTKYIIINLISCDILFTDLLSDEIFCMNSVKINYVCLNHTTDIDTYNILKKDVCVRRISHYNITHSSVLS